MVSRELMLISHQNRMEQLQVALRQKMRNEDNWREKVILDVQFQFLFSFFPVVVSCHK